MKKSIKRLPKQAQKELTTLQELVRKGFGNCQMIILVRQLGVHPLKKLAYFNQNTRKKLVILRIYSYFCAVQMYNQANETIT